MAKGKGKAKEKQATDADLFVVDEAGDETLRRQLQSSTWDNPAAAHARKGSGKPLKSAQILAQRSRVPSITSKAQPGAMVKYKLEREKLMKITPDLKRRLRGMVKRDGASDRGLWDVSQSAAKMVERADLKSAGEYDVWASTSQQTVAKKAPSADIEDIVKARQPKAPATLNKHQFLDKDKLPRAIALPHPGESYNPMYDDHQAILAVEHAKALAEEEELARQAEMKNKIMQGREENPRSTRESGYADEVGSGDEDEEHEDNIAEEGGEESEKKKKKQRRKTEKERKKRQANMALEAEMRARKRLTKAQKQALSSLSSINKSLQGSSSISLSQLHKRKSELAARMATAGLAEMRSGPSRVPKPKQSYLLTDELPEGLRQLKTNGNLWNEWLDSSRRRGKVQMERNTNPGMRKQKGRSLRDKEKVAWRKWELGM